jgi:hypothetical protein
LPAKDWAAVSQTCKSWNRDVVENVSQLRPGAGANNLRKYSMLLSLDLLETASTGLRLSSCPPSLRHVALRPGSVARFFNRRNSDPWRGLSIAELEHVTIVALPGESSDEPLRLYQLPSTLTTLYIEHCASCWQEFDSPLRMLPRECARSLTELSLKATILNWRTYTPFGAVTRGLMGLDELVQLRTLDLSHNLAIGPPEMSLVAHLHRLTSLDLSHIAFMDVDGLRSLRPLQHLTVLLMTDTPWFGTADGLSEAGEFPKLQRLSLPDTRFVTGDVVGYLRMTQVTPMLSGIAKLRDLRELCLDERLFHSALWKGPVAASTGVHGATKVSVLLRGAPSRHRKFHWYACKRMFPDLRTLSFCRAQRIRARDLIAMQRLVDAFDVTVVVRDLDDKDCTQRLFEVAPWRPWASNPALIDSIVTV